MIYSFLTSRTMAPAVVVIVVLILWQVIHSVFNLPSYILPSPVEVAEALYRFHGPIALHAASTLTTTS